MRRLCAVLLLLVAFACAPTVSDCLPVDESLLSGIGIPEAAATLISVEKEPGSLARTGKVWFVATPRGAVWATNEAKEGGLILALNELARATSDVGSEVDFNAPVYAGITDDHEGAQAAVRCAQP